MFMQLQAEMISLATAIGEFSRGRYSAVHVSCYDHQMITVGDATGVNFSHNGISHKHSFYFCRCPEIFKTTT